MVAEKDALRSWLYLVVNAILMITIFAISSSTGVFVVIFINEFNETNAKAGWMSSIILFLLFSLCPFVIHVHQAIGFGPSMAIAGSFYVLSFLITGFMPSLNFLYFTFSIPFGICVAIVAFLTTRSLKNYFHKFHGLAMGVHFASISLGAALHSFSVPVIYDELGFRNTFLLFLLFSPIFGLLAFVAQPKHTTTQSQINKSFRGNIKIYQELVQDKSFVLCLVGTTLFFLVEFTALIYVVRYGVTLGHPLSQAKWLLITRHMTTLPARLVVGRFSDIAFRHNKVKLLHWLSYPIFGLASFLCSFVHSFPLLLVYMGVNGVIQAVFWVTFSLYVDEITGGYHSDEAYALICFMSAFTSLIGPPALGRLFDLTGEFRYVFYSIFVVSLFSGFLICASSFVKVEKEFSLREKGANRPGRSEVVKLTENKEDQKVGVTYETAV